MNNPPDPGFPPASPAILAELLEDVARYTFVVTTRDAADVALGLFIVGGEQTPLVMVGAGGNSVQWRIFAQRDLTPHLLSSATLTILRGAKLNADHTITYQGKSYQLRARWNGSHSVAEASPI